MSGVEGIPLDFQNWMVPTEWDNGGIDGTTWHRLLRSFIRVKELRVGISLSEELSRALQVGEIGSDPGFLPDLQELNFWNIRNPPASLFDSFIHARRVVGRPVRPSSALNSSLTDTTTRLFSSPVPVS